MEIMQKTFLHMDTSGAWVEENSNLWLNILIAVVAIAVAVITVAATIASGGAALTIILAAAGAVIKIAAGAAVAFYAVNTLHLGSSGFYLPEYQLTPEAIFRNEILAFDVNFFNPREPELSTIAISTFTDNDAIINYEAILYDKNSNEMDIMKQLGTPGFPYSKMTIRKAADSVLQYKLPELKGTEPDKETFEVYEIKEGKQITEICIENTYYIDETTGLYAGHYKSKQHCTLKYGDYRVEVYYYIEYYNGWISPTERIDGTDAVRKEVSEQNSPAFILQPTIASWYLALRNIALVALLSILVYVGIRITLSSVASDKAKYKQMLVDWTIALALVFLMHYIMSFTVTINEKIVEAIASIGPSSAGTIEDFTKNKVAEIETPASLEAPETKKDGKQYENEDDIDQQAIHLFRIVDGAEKAYDVLVGTGNSKAVMQKSGDYSRFKNRFYEENGKKVLYWPAYDYMTQARMLGQGTIYEEEELTSTEEKNIDKTQEAVIRSGYKIIYVVLVIYTVIFCFTYLKRVVYMAFLTVIAPLVAITYPIDKMSDGKAQAFDMWLKEYIFNLLIQPIHLVLYTILVTSAIKFASKNIFYVVIALGFLVPAEKMLRSFFGFEKAKTPGIFGGPAGAALLMTGINKLMHPKHPQGKLGNGESEYNENEENIRTTQYIGEDPYNELVLAAGENNQDININSDSNNNSNNDNNVKVNQKAKTDNNTMEENNSENYTLDNRFSGYDNSTVNFDGRVSGSGNELKLSVEEKKRREKILKQQSKDLEKIQKGRSFKRALKRGLNIYGNGIKRRYTMNKARNGGIIKRGIRLAGGIATAGTMAAAGGIIGIATGDISKAAQYMTAGAVGGYTLGKVGVHKVSNKIEEQYKEPIREAKIGFYGEKGYEEKQHEKWKKNTFEKNSDNIGKIQEYLGVSKEEAKEIAKDIANYTDKNGIKSFEDALAIKKLQEDGNYSESEAILVGYLHNVTFGGRHSEQLSRKEREGRKEDIRDKLGTQIPGLNEETANREAEKLMAGTVRFSKFKKQFSVIKKNTEKNNEENN